MFGFRRKPAVQQPSAALARALVASGLPPGCNDPTTTFRVVERKERYSGRKVTQVRIFDPSQAEARGIPVGAYDDLDWYPELVLWTGRVEQDGTANITRQASAASTVGPMRQAADRTAHADVEHLLDQSVGRGEHERYSRDAAQRHAGDGDDTTV
jgi:hypothetical protein